MKSFSNLTLDEKITATETLAKNTLASSEILQFLAAFNVNENYVNETLTFAETARTASNIQKKEYGEQYTATNQRDSMLDKVEATYDDTEGIARLVLANADFSTALKIGIPLPRRIGTKIERIRSFYDGVLGNADLLTLMARFNKGVEVIEAEKADVEVLTALQQAQLKETGEAQLATQKRNDAMEQMVARYRELATLLKIALGRRNDLLEVVGLFVRS